MRAGRRSLIARAQGPWDFTPWSLVGMGGGKSEEFPAERVKERERERDAEFLKRRRDMWGLAERIKSAKEKEGGVEEEAPVGGPAVGLSDMEEGCSCALPPPPSSQKSLKREIVRVSFPGEDSAPVWVRAPESDGADTDTAAARASPLSMYKASPALTKQSAN